MRNAIKILIVISFVAMAFVACSKNDPKPVRKKTENLYAKGEALFKRDCRGCHSLTMDLRSTAPALGGVTTRFDKTWLYKYTKDSYGMVQAGDSTAVALFEQNGKLVMPSFPSLTDSDLDAIYHFVEKRYKITKAQREKTN